MEQTFFDQLKSQSNYSCFPLDSDVDQGGGTTDLLRGEDTMFFPMANNDKAVIKFDVIAYCKHSRSHLYMQRIFIVSNPGGGLAVTDTLTVITAGPTDPTGVPNVVVGADSFKLIWDSSANVSFNEFGGSIKGKVEILMFEGLDYGA